MLVNETIVAIATPMSSSGIGIIRISGANAFTIADRLYESKNGKKVLSKQNSHTIHYGYIKDQSETLDEVLVSIMKGPNSYTGEDTVEINCHGGVFVMKRVLELVVKNGARPAEPGEFTKRAFLNGKMDLSQAEAVMDLIDSKNQYALKSSVTQLKGSVYDKIEKIRAKILFETAFIETALDDPEHISLEGYSEKLGKVVEENLIKIDSLIHSFDDGRILKEGIKTVIIGKPNAGKSSLLNLLAGSEKAIVTDIEGTTRDIIEESINIGGITLNVFDTAGIRDTEDVVEKIGVTRAKEYANDADLIIYVVDSSKDLDENDMDIFEIIKEKKSIVLLNKSDLDNKITIDKIREYELDENIPVLPISAAHNTGIKELEDSIKTLFFRGEISLNDEIYITNMRQKSALGEARESLNKVLESIQMLMPEDFYSIDLIDAYESLGKITGETIGEDLVNEIFSKFCMGK